MLDRQKMSTVIRDATEKAGTLVVAALVIASCALVIALVALVKVSHAS